MCQHTSRNVQIIRVKHTIAGIVPKPPRYVYHVLKISLRSNTNLKVKRIIRFASGGQADGDDHNAARMEKPTRFGAVQLGRSQIGLFRQVMNCIDKNWRFATESWGVGHDLSGAIWCQFKSTIKLHSSAFPTLYTAHSSFFFFFLPSIVKQKVHTKQLSQE